MMVIPNIRFSEDKVLFKKNLVFNSIFITFVLVDKLFYSFLLRFNYGTDTEK
jgi:hypothetical protein